jgi:hypothetical protein
MLVCAARTRAQGTVEYGLVILLIVVVVLLAVANFGRLVEPWLASLAGRITTVGNDAANKRAESSH